MINAKKEAWEKGGGHVGGGGPGAARELATKRSHPKPTGENYKVAICVPINSGDFIPN